MKKALSTILILSITSLTFSLSVPRPVQAVDKSIGSSVQAGIDAAISTQASLPAVPTTDKLNDAKEVKICTSILKKAVCFPGLDKIAITVAKAYIERIVDSTVEWINNGFDGNPAYVTDPKRFFLDIANGEAGNFIKGIEIGGKNGTTTLDFLCSPFKANIKISLIQNFRKHNPYECSLTKVIGNIDDFYKDFTQGGWDAWFTMTQNTSNNPYSAYLEAKIDLDSRIASAVGLENQRLDWGKGFLSFNTCAVKEDVYEDNGNGTATRKDGKCLVPGETVTPGTVIENQFEKVFGAGFDQLELADEFDELIGALLGQLFKKTIFSDKGLFTKDQYKVSETEPINPNDGGGGDDGGGNTGEPTEWAWDDHGGPAFESSKCPSINPQEYFEGLRGGAPISAWKETLSGMDGALWSCGIGQQKTSGGEVRGRLFLPTAACPDASPLPGQEGLGVRQEQACWAHEVDVVGFSGSGNGGGPEEPPTQ